MENDEKEIKIEFISKINLSRKLQDKLDTEILIYEVMNKNDNKNTLVKWYDDIK